MSDCPNNRPHGGVEATPAQDCDKRKQKRTPLGELSDREVGAFTYDR